MKNICVLEREGKRETEGEGKGEKMKTKDYKNTRHAYFTLAETKRKSLRSNAFQRM